MPTAYWGCVVAGVQESDSRHLAPGSATGARRQMGPASLPTPLSPMRGRVPSTRVFKGHRLGIRCFPFRPFENGLQVPSPALAPASGSTLRSARFRLRCDPRIARLPCPAALQRAVPQPGLPLVAGASNDHIAIRSKDLCAAPSSATDRDGPARNEKPSPFRHRPALRPARGLGTRVSKSAWTEPAASSRFPKVPTFQIVRSSW